MALPALGTSAGTKKVPVQPRTTYGAHHGTMKSLLRAALTGTVIGAMAVVLPPRVTAQATGPAEEPELPHPFFTHMGLPEGVGNFNLRVLGLATRADGSTDGDFAFHLETGLTPNLGLHIRNDRIRTNEKTEAMFQYTALISKDGLSGFAPLIEFEFPTHRGASRINTLVGFTTSLGARRWAFNQVLHYDPREDAIDASAALVLGANRVVFPVVEVLGEGGTDRPSVVNALVGVKIRLRDWLIGGVAVAIPLTNARDYTLQVALGPDLEWRR